MTGRRSLHPKRDEGSDPFVRVSCSRDPLGVLLETAAGILPTRTVLPLTPEPKPKNVQARHDRHFLGSLTLPIKGCGTRGTVGRPHPRTGTGIRPGWLVPPVSHLLIRMVFAAPDTQPYPSRAHHARALDPLHPAEVDPYCTGGYVKPQRPPRADCRPWVPPARNPLPLANLPIGAGPCLKGYG